MHLFHVVRRLPTNKQNDISRAKLRHHNKVRVLHCSVELRSADLLTVVELGNGQTDRRRESVLTSPSPTVLTLSGSCATPRHAKPSRAVDAMLGLAGLG